MAEDKKGGKKDGKKDDKKEGGGGGKALEVEILFIVFMIIVIGFVVFPRVVQFFGGDLSHFFTKEWFAQFQFDAGRWFAGFFSSMTFVSIFASLLFIIGIIYARFKNGQVKTISEVQSGSAKSPDDPSPISSAVVLPGSEPMQFTKQENKRWKDVEAHMQSTNQSDWRLAILEADIMLYDMLEQMGYPGDSIGEKLKQVESSSFYTLDEAWRAHKVRNIIAHEGAAYDLPRGEADRTIDMFRKVFKEFYYI